MDWNDIPEIEELEVKKKRKVEQSPEDHLKEEAYKHQVRIVQLSQIDYARFIQYLLDNENFLKNNISDYNKECLRSTCQRAMERFSYDVSAGDSRIFDRIFGIYIEPKRSSRILVVGDNKSLDNDPYKLQIAEQVKWFSQSSYERFWQWMNNEETQKKLASRPDLKERLQEVIESQICRNVVWFSGHKKFEESDRAVYESVLGMME